MKFKTILEGEQAVIFNYLGEGKLVIGPKRVFLFRKRLQKLSHYTATAHQYLRIKDNQGYVTHELGPCEMFLNPLEHNSITVQKATEVDANHVVVVYKKLKNQSVERRIVTGPTIFMPEAEEWLHQFKWHGADTDDLGRMIPGHNAFTHLNIIPSHFYYNVRDVRTTDDTMLSVKLLIFYEITDILTLLEKTNDPIADLIKKRLEYPSATLWNSLPPRERNLANYEDLILDKNKIAVCADVIGFAGKRTLNEFLENSNELNGINPYQQLIHRASTVGITISNVVYRGYHAGDKLQAMQDATIQSRTEMRLKSEIQEQEQKLKDFKLQMEQDRSNLSQEMEQTKLQHSQNVQLVKESHSLEMNRLQHNAKIEKATMSTTVGLELETKKQKQNLQHLTNLKDLKVDLTSYLVQKEEMAPTEEYRIIGQ